MALEGNLTAFGLSEILQLIAVQQKTGMLTVTNVDANTVMFFRDGEFVSTRDRRRKSRDSFKEYLTRYGVLERDALVRISQIAAQSKLDFIDILTSEGFLTPEELSMHWRKQVQETLHDVLTWEEGTYKFVASKELVDGVKSPESFNVEAMLMECMRRIDEFPMMLDMFPSEKLVFHRRDNNPSPEEMSRNEASILSLLNEPTPLVDLIARGRMPVFEVYEALKNLREKGLTRMEEPEPDGDELSIDSSVGARKRRALRNVLPLLAAFALFTGALYVGFGDAVAELSPQRIVESELLSGGDAVRDRTEHRLRWLIEAYRAETGAYPVTLGELFDSGLASRRFRDKARAYEFRYRLTPGGSDYTLL